MAGTLPPFNASWREILPKKTMHLKKIKNLTRLLQCELKFFEAFNAPKCIRALKNIVKKSGPIISIYLMENTRARLQR